MHGFLIRFAALVLVGLCAACTTMPVGSRADLRAWVSEAGASAKQLPWSAPAYQAAVNRVAETIRREGAQAALARLRREGVAVHLPNVSLPLRELEISKVVPQGSDAVGVPVVLVYDTAQHPMYPPEGLFVGATLLVESPAGKPALTIRADGGTVRLAGRNYPVAINPTAAGDHLRERARKLRGSGLASMLRPGSMERKPQVYLLDPYDPAKIPLLMVHGLQSTPVAFATMVNALRSDPAIRAKYQIWQFYYPSGTPVLANAASLRDSLEHTLRTLDPGVRHAASRRIVVIGHSMGGVISHSLVSSSGDAVWNSVFRVAPERLNGNREVIRSLERILRFEKNRRVTRVIFMAAPHHGSPMADSPVGQFGNFLARLSPLEETQFTQLARENPRAMQPDAAKFYAAGRFSAVRTLSPKSTALIAVAKLPISVPYHSVIGQQYAGPKEQGSDGVVPYWSSHLPGAQSELVVRSGHGVIDKPEAIREVIRILLLPDR